MDVFCTFWIPTLFPNLRRIRDVYGLIPPVQRTHISLHHHLMISNTRRQTRVTTCENVRMLMGQRGGKGESHM